VGKQGQVSWQLGQGRAIRPSTDSGTNQGRAIRPWHRYGEASCNRRYRKRWRILIKSFKQTVGVTACGGPPTSLIPSCASPAAGRRADEISCRSRRPAVKVTGPYQPPVCDHHIEQPNLSHLEQVARSAERSQISHCRLSRGRTRGVQSGSYNPLDHWRAVDAGAQESVECTAAARLA